MLSYTVYCLCHCYFRYGDHKFDLPKAVGSCDPSEPIILLAHQPKAAKWALDSEYPIDLVLSGERT